MLTHQQFIEKMLEFWGEEIRFKEIHRKVAEGDIKGDFERDYSEYIKGVSNNEFISGERRWYSTIANFDYPRVFKERNTDVLKNGRYYLPFLHVHDFYEFIFIYQGKCYHTAGKKEIVLNPGDLCYVAPGEVHSVYTNSDDSIAINIIVSYSTMKEILALFHGRDNIFTQNIKAGDSSCSCMIIKDKDNYIKNAVEKLCRLKFGGTEYTEQFVIAALTDIFTFCISENILPDIMKRESKASVFMFEILGYIKMNYKELSLEMLSEKFGLTPQYMSGLIRKETGKTFKKIVNGIKVDEACKLLDTTDFRVIDIAYEVGFNSPEHFIRTFKEYTKMKPNEFRNLKKHQ